MKGYPTIKFFPGGKKDGDAQDYDGGRTAGDIVNWALDKYAENVPPPEVRQVIIAQLATCLVLPLPSCWYVQCTVSRLLRRFKIAFSIRDCVAEDVQRDTSTSSDSVIQDLSRTASVCSW